MSDARAEEQPSDEGENEGEDSYANAYLDDDDAQDSDEDELAEMLAKVQSIQEIESRLQPSVPQQSTAQSALEVVCSQDGAMCKTSGKASGKSTPTTNLTAPRKSQSLSRSPSAAIVCGSTGSYRSQDGITTIPRNALSGKAAGVEVLLGVKKPALYDDKLLQTVKATNTLARLKQRTVTAAPATIAERIEALSAPAKKSSGRKFASDEEERHCRFQPRKTAAQRAAAKNSSCGYDFDSGGGGTDSNDFITRMEAAEKNRRKKLEMTRGENDYNARLDKKCCPKCEIPQSYSEFRDKKKKCQMCGVEFRVLQAWGDVGRGFISRMAQASRAQEEKKEQIFAQVTAQESNLHKVHKTAQQLRYEKHIDRQNKRRTFLERNYHPTSDSKSKQAQLQILEAKRMASQR